MAVFSDEAFNNLCVPIYKEEDVLEAWAKIIKRENPDIITGYNIFGFDYRYMYERAEELDCLDKFTDIGKVINSKAYLEEKKLSSAAMGHNELSILKKSSFS